MSIITSLILFAVFWVSLVYADGGMQLGFTIAAIAGILLNGLYAVYKGY